MSVCTARSTQILLVSAVTLLLSPSLAFASWSAPVSRGAIVLGYGASYGGCTHRGVDLSASAGESVSSPVDGTVTFAGAVPADGGGTCRAVTVEMADGQRVSLMPLAESRVSEGAAVRAGEMIGYLAGSGDSSSPETHVHISLRRGESYLDPSGLLPACTAPAAEPVVQTPAAAGVVPPAPSTSSAVTALASSAAPVTAVSTPAAAAASASAPSVVPVTLEAVLMKPVRMPRDAQETLPVMLHSAQASRMRGLRLPSGIVATPSVLVAIALGALLAVVAAFVTPGRALDRL